MLLLCQKPNKKLARQSEIYGKLLFDFTELQRLASITKIEAFFYFANFCCTFFYKLGLKLGCGLILPGATPA